MPIKTPEKLLKLLAQGSHHQFMKCLDEVCFEIVGFKLYSLTKIEGNDGTVCRIYTTDEDSYPAGGYKPIPENLWTEKVIDKQQSFLATSIEEISTVFYDYELIESLGLGSVINVPVILFGKVIGTVNLLHEKGFYTQDSIQKIQQLMPWFVIVMSGSFHKGKYIGDQS